MNGNRLRQQRAGGADLSFASLLQLAASCCHANAGLADSAVPCTVRTPGRASFPALTVFMIGLGRCGLRLGPCRLLAPGSGCRFASVAWVTADVDFGSAGTAGGFRLPVRVEGMHFL